MKLLYSTIQRCIMPAVAILFVTLTAVLPASAQETFEQRLAKLGIDKSECVDWSDSANIAIPKPICAYINITGITSIPTKWTTTYKVWMEAYDGMGNYFKKRITLALQGRSSARWAKRNFKVDFFNDEWVGDNTPDIAIGDWVEQDGFHFKAFYLDYFKGTGIIGYKLYDEITADRGATGRIWERATNIKKPDARALCHPDAFPCAVYLSGKFYGMYCWQLKKHRKNMNMKKHTPEHVYMDGTRLDKSTIFGGTIVWSRLELRNPKDLYSMTGKLYDRDNPDELIDETSPYYDLATDSEEVKEYKRISAQSKKYILALSKYGSEIQTLINQKAGTQAIRAAIAERFDVESVIDYIIHNMLTNNFDGIQQNYQWFTYDGKKWFVAPYDLDTTFGNFPVNFVIFPAQYYYIYPVSSWTFNGYQPLNWIRQYYKNDIDARYASLRDRGVVNAENVASLFYNWYHTLGESNMSNEWKKWPSSPCILNTIPNAQWELMPYTYSKYNSTADYSSTTTYNAGDYCRSEYRLWKAKTTVTGVRPYKQVGCKDSLERIFPWMQQRLVSVDAWMNYSFTSLPISHTLTISSVGWSTLCVPFKFPIPEGLELYTVTGYDENGMLEMRRVMEPQAYKPYLVKGHPGDYQLIGQTEKADEGAADYLTNGIMRGCLSPRYVPQDCYVLQSHNGKASFYRVQANGTIKMGSNRAYIEFDGESRSNLDIFDDTTPTYVSVAEQEAEIVGIYTKDGMRQPDLSPGVNIIKYSNGKTVKIVVR